ncbi:MAG: nitrogenase-stabilizing/protective protein NifW [Marinospirillum sp.]|uniref:nitrogenase-stabilizing/protective protein NifW n=1 Tax=Marinospirillum sp. TaxID=2183934 RepID=UPI001A080019|nr:nitrogenase-stabilizing/protective protein NifW [Marinospirillum sp.]MBE0506711.1 nitrogenase-stabilizing/protective protein NifW [Marinospirillum sp.]
MNCPEDIKSLEDFEDALQELESAEDFLLFFQVDFDARVVQVNRLHILQRFHNLLSKTSLPEDLDQRFSVHQTLLQQAYQSFVHSSAQQEKVLKVFNRGQPGSGFVSLGAIGGVK